ncbi:hypothetical protein [Draconibacterium sediminis]|uniref:DUF304 domain-containing protein n=1 Tax=Draconibacterium sediminis TaxID=1544798 RepID=A0A0D8J821_9BACT|nr:hypothetical protein [Draconibacterium sediminis]KJF42929.1 hypothetical protein LH29_16135 [Draconibacterium sediminis]
MNRINSKTYHQLKYYNNYNHLTVAGVLVVFGLLMLVGISTFPKNLVLALLFFTLAYLGYQTLKTTKPISIDRNNICLGKMVNGFKQTNINANSIDSIELVYEIKTEFSVAAAYIGGEVDKHSDYYQIKLKDNSLIRFDNLYDKQLQNDLKLWCRYNNVAVNLNVRKIIKENDDSIL